MAEPPVPHPRPGAPHPARRLSTEQLEAVVRRAVELQAHEAEHDADSGITEQELLRIGQELGIAPVHMRRAIAEVGTHGAPPALADRTIGASRVSASRTVAGDAEELREHINRYLLECEYLAVLRRLPDHTIYEKSGGLQTELARMWDAVGATFAGAGRRPRIGAGFQLRDARAVELAVQPLEEGFAYVTFTADLGNQRTGYLATAAVGGGLGTLATGAVLAVAIAPPAALIGLPILGASLWGARVGYAHVLKRAQLHLEALLDHLERGESLVPGRRFRLRFG